MTRSSNGFGDDRERSLVRGHRCAEERTHRDYQRVSDGLIRSSGTLNRTIEESNVLSQYSRVGGDCFHVVHDENLGPDPAPLASGANLSKEVPAIGHRKDLKTMQQTLRSKGYYRGEVDGVFGLRTRASIRGIQNAKNPVAGQLDTQTAGKLGLSPEVARSLTARLRKANLRQA